MSKPIFRQESLDRLQSPEELDQLLVVVNRKAWLILLTLALICGAGIAWSIYGRIPVRVDGVGVLVNPGNVKGIQSPASGQVTAVEMRVGGNVAVGTVLALLDQPEIRKELDQLKNKRENTLAFHKSAVELDTKKRFLELESFEKQRAFIASEVEKSTALALRVVEKETSFSEEQKRNIEKTKKLTLQLNSTLKKQLETIHALRLEGLSSQQLVVGAESSMADSEIRLANLDVQQKELEMSALQRERSQIDNQNRLADLSLDLMKLDISVQRLQQEMELTQQTRRNEITEIDNAIARLELKLELEGQIVSDCAGTILDVSIQPGQVVGLGTRVGTVEKTDPDGKLTNLAFFSVLDGKRVSVDDVVRVTPSTVQREREGSILGSVRRVSAFPVTQESVISEVGNAEIATSLIKQGGAIEVEVELERDPNSYSGFRWTSKGPDKHFTAGTTTSVRITIEQRAPITYLLPILRSWFTGAKDAKTPRI